MKFKEKLKNTSYIECYALQKFIKDEINKYLIEDNYERTKSFTFYVIRIMN